LSLVLISVSKHDAATQPRDGYVMVPLQKKDRMFPHRSYARPGGRAALVLVGILLATTVPQSALAATPEPAPELTAGTYIVTLKNDPIVTYDGDLKGYDQTSSTSAKHTDPQSDAATHYRDYLSDRHATLAASVGADILVQYFYAINGFAAKLTATQAKALADNPDVLTLDRDAASVEPLQSTGPESSGLTGPNGVWETHGSGKGIVVGVIDSGITPENPSFDGDRLTTRDPAMHEELGEPYLAKSKIHFRKADGTIFRGTCQAGKWFPVSECNSKLIGARYFAAGVGANRDSSDPLTPRDIVGHGTHVAGIAVGNKGVSASVTGKDMGPISGTAPEAKLAVYKTGWLTKVAGEKEPSMVSHDVDVIQAIDAAIEDNVDVINYSLVGPGHSRTALALKNAASAGIFIAAAGANTGPTPGTIENDYPWVTTVAASTLPGNEAQIHYEDAGALQIFYGGSVSLPGTSEGVKAKLVAGPRAGRDGIASNVSTACSAGALDPNKSQGAIIACVARSDRAAQVAEVQRVGGVGVIFFYGSSSEYQLGYDPIPSVDIGKEETAKFVSALVNSAAPVVTLQRPRAEENAAISQRAPRIAGFSSRGPSMLNNGDIVKPDLAAPGVRILSGTLSETGGTPNFAFESGTSQAAPHIAGLAALYLGTKPTASPMEIRSAMMTTAYDTESATGQPSNDALAQGAGQVKPASMFDPGLVYLNESSDWDAYLDGSLPGGDSELNAPSIGIGGLQGVRTVTRTVTALTPGTYQVQPINIPGIDTVVFPAQLNFRSAGETLSYDVTFRNISAPVNQFVTGHMTWTDQNNHTVRSPIAIRPSPFDFYLSGENGVNGRSPDVIAGSGLSGSARTQLVAGAKVDLSVASSGLTKGVSQEYDCVGGRGSIKQIVVAPKTEFLALTFSGPNINDVAFQLTNPSKQSSYVAKTASAGSVKNIFVDAPEAGTYTISAICPPGEDVFTTEGIQYAMVPGGSTNQPVKITPNKVVATARSLTEVTATWSKLPAETRYIGRVTYGTEDRYTYVQVSTGKASDSPIDPGTELR
jgi:subtilisin family serine protease